MNAMEKFCADQQAKIDELRDEIHEQRQEHREELLKVNTELACKRSDLKFARYEIESLKRQVETLKELLDDEHKRRLERFNSTKKKGSSLSISENLLDKLAKTNVNGHPVAHNSIYETPSVLGREVSCRGYNEIDRELFNVLNGVEDDDGKLLAQEHKMVNHDSYFFVLGSGVVLK
jgi:chromosome segregation ATPase